MQVTKRKLSQLKNAKPCISVKEAGNVMDVNGPPLNVLFPIVSKPSGNLISFKFSHELKAQSGMFLICVSYIFICFNAVFIKQFVPISVKAAGSMFSPLSGNVQ